MEGRVQALSVEGFRSVRGLEVKFGDVNLITGANGCGKSNLFNAFRLIKSAVTGGLAKALADEGGLDSVLWAGPRSKGPVRMRIGAQIGHFEYVIELGLRPASEFPLFPTDPQIKEEIVRLAGRPLVDRKTSVATMRDVDGSKELRADLLDTESIFAQIQDPDRYPTLFQIREMVGRWTFYHEFRTDVESPLRRPAVPTYASKLADDGSNLGPALYVIANQGDRETLLEILSRAFGGAEFDFRPDSVAMVVGGVGRAMGQHELSDGTLKFLALAAACFAKRPPPLIAFNEPENSLSPAAIEPLADLLTYAAQYSQLWITTHSAQLAKAMVDRTACKPIRLEKVDGETTREGKSMTHGWAEDED